MSGGQGLAGWSWTIQVCGVCSREGGMGVAGLSQRALEWSKRASGREGGVEKGRQEVLAADSRGRAQREKEASLREQAAGAVASGHRRGEARRRGEQ